MKNSRPCWLGVDPGHSGGFAIISSTGVEWVCKTKKTNGKQTVSGTIATFLEIRDVCLALELQPTLCGLETVVYAALGTKATMFAQGLNVGMIQGVASAFGWQTVLVSPLSWSKGLQSAKDLKFANYAKRRIWVKKRNIEAVKQKFLCIVDEPVADAILIADYISKQKKGDLEKNGDKKNKTNNAGTKRVSVNKRRVNPTLKRSVGAISKNSGSTRKVKSTKKRKN